MLCEVCKKKEANYFVSCRINGREMELHLCPECARRLKADMESGSVEKYPWHEPSASGRSGPGGEESFARGGAATAQETEEEQGSALQRFGCDLTAMAEAGKCDPVIGREGEVRRLMEILCRRSKNNPVLIGEPGVGKTAVVEGLAQRVAEGKVPPELRGKRVISLDVSGMLAGAKYRGEFEERLKGAIDEVKQRGDVLLFIDEIHTIVGAGAAEGAMDAANILKPSLARGELHLIGATTIGEYRKHIEKDPALERRFQPVMVEEPTQEDSIAILRGLRPKYEQHHKLTIEDEAVEAAVRLSARYVPDRFLPDKAIDLMDEAAAKVHLTLCEQPDAAGEIEARLKAIRAEKAEAVKAQDYEQAAVLRDREEEQQAELEKVKQAQGSEPGRRVTAEDVAAVVSAATGIPVASLTGSETEKLLHMEEILHRRVVGQEEAVTAVARAVRRGRSGLKDPKRPVGSFLFLGPTGVGKTELCKALAEAVFGDENAMIRVDMSEYMEKYSVSKMIGSAPGYVGFEEGGQLTEKVRRKPYSVVLFDEIEKADEDVFNILLQILDDGRLTDSQGRTVDFRNTILVMTSNIGARDITSGRRPSVGFAGAEEEPGKADETIRELVTAELRRTFRPEFLNRIDSTLIFRQLSRDDVRRIADNLLADLRARLQENGVALTVGEEALQALCDEGFDPQYGARPLRRVIRSRVEDPAAELLLSGRLPKGSTAELVLREGELALLCPEPAPAAA